MTLRSAWLQRCKPARPSATIQTAHKPDCEAVANTWLGGTSLGASRGPAQQVRYRSRALHSRYTTGPESCYPPLRGSLYPTPTVQRCCQMRTVRCVQQANIESLNSHEPVSPVLFARSAYLRTNQTPHPLPDVKSNAYRRGRRRHSVLLRESCVEHRKFRRRAKCPGPVPLSARGLGRDPWLASHRPTSAVPNGFVRSLASSQYLRRRWRASSASRGAIMHRRTGECADGCVACVPTSARRASPIRARRRG